MSKFCANCGNGLEDNAAFCNKCGSPVEFVNQNNNMVGATVINNSSNMGAGAPIQKREIVTAILLTIVTCGIYGIYWFVKLTDESNEVSGSDAASGALAIVYTLITCGIYTIYWNYKMGQKMHEAGKRYGIEIADNSVLYLILSIFGLGIVNYCLIQSDLNRLAK